MTTDARLPLLLISLACNLLTSSPTAARDFSTVEIKATHVGGNVHMLVGAGGNIGVSVGDDGILIVDDQFAPLADKIRAALGELNKGKLRFVLNTHWHGDHTGGNPKFGEEATIIAHDNVRKRLSGELRTRGRESTPLPKEGLPVITFAESLTVHFNDEEIDVIHFPSGHTDGDSVVFFKESNVVHMGDLFFNGSFPFVDLASGGDVEGYLRNVKAIAERLPAGVKIIPGHGQLATRSDVTANIRMLTETVEIVRQRMSANQTLDQARHAGLPAEWDDWGKGFIKTDRWIETIYRSLTAHAAAREPANRRRRAAFTPIEDDPNLPRVLLIGDSISIGYTLATREFLKAEANVHRPPTNCGPTSRGLAHIEAWLGDSRWDVIHFNWGLHDLKYVDAEGRNTSPEKGRQQVPPDAYERNLETLVARLKKTKAKLVFATTTPVPPNEGKRVAGDARNYNKIARRVMAKHDVAIDDLHGFALARLDAIQLPHNVHFKPEGSRVLASQVAASIREALAAKAAAAK